MNARIPNEQANRLIVSTRSRARSHFERPGRGAKEAAYLGIVANSQITVISRRGLSCHPVRAKPADRRHFSPGQMNLTFAFLSLSSLNRAPYFASSSRHFPWRYSFTQIHSLRFLAPFSFNLLPAKYSQCSFRQMLNSAISVSDRRVFQSENIELALAGPEDDLVEIVDSQFQSRSQYNGGAINMLKWGSTLSVTRTGFYSCSGGYRGGAISFFGQNFHVRTSCFVYCESADAGMAIEMQLDGSNSTSDFQSILVYQCGLRRVPLTRGIQALGT
jgi:hypothetical protein